MFVMIEGKRTRLHIKTFLETIYGSEYAKLGNKLKQAIIDNQFSKEQAMKYLESNFP